MHDAYAPRPTLGLDMSYSSAGVAVFHRDLMLSRAFTEGAKLRGAERLEWFFRTINELATRYNPALAVIEDYAFDSQWGREAAGELGGVTRLALHMAGIPYKVASISQSKKFATGIGNCDKAIVARELYKRYGVDAVGNDESDACGLALFGAAKLHLLGEQGFSIALTAKQAEAVEALGTPKPKKARKKV